MFRVRLQRWLTGRSSVVAGTRSRGFRPQVEALEERLAPADYSWTPEVDVLTRLARYEPKSLVPSVSDWESVTADDADLDPTHPNGRPTNLYVVTHGWAPGFRKMVDAYATAHPGDVLKWWQTLDTTLPNAPSTPASDEMFHGAEKNGTQISPVGLAAAIAAVDPNAVVLAYSWIDNSATADDLGVIPAHGYESESYTAMNGKRLANALELALPITFGGSLHVFGHSHGSKVATTATLALNETNVARFHVTQLSVLDSPEVYATVPSVGAFVRQFDLANNLWYFLGGLDISHENPLGTQTFVDHYISQVDNFIGPIQGHDPFDTSQLTGALQQIVDVNLKGRVLYSADSALLHSYAFNWYNGGSLNPTPPDPPVAINWSPLLNVANLPTAGSYTQTWTTASQPQFQLTPGPPVNTVKVTPAFYDQRFPIRTVTSGASYDSSTGEVVLQGTSTPTFTGLFQPKKGLDGISFQYQFTDVGQGDQLVISVGLPPGLLYKTYYVMTGTVAGLTQGVGTLSLSSLGIIPVPHLIKIELIPASGSSGARVTINNLQQFTLKYTLAQSLGADASSASPIIGAALKVTLGLGVDGATGVANNVVNDLRSAGAGAIFLVGRFPRSIAAPVLSTSRVNGSNDVAGNHPLSGHAFNDANGTGEAERGEGLAHATVLLEVYRGGQWEKVAETKTDKDGQFSFTGLPEGSYRFRIPNASKNTVIKTSKPVQPASPPNPGAALRPAELDHFVRRPAAPAAEGIPELALSPVALALAWERDDGSSGVDLWTGLDRTALPFLAGLCLAGFPADVPGKRKGRARCQGRP